VSRAASGEGELSAGDAWLWSCKILYGILLKESTLRSAISDPSSGSIVSDDQLRDIRGLLLLLQMARKRSTVSSRAGFSLVYRVQSPVDQNYGFDLWTLFPWLAISVRVGQIGVLSVFGDCGRTQQFMSGNWQDLKSKSLHPLQFTELSARFFDCVARVSAKPKINYIESDNDLHIEVLPEGIGGSEVEIREYDPSVYPRLLAMKLGLRLEDVSPRPGLAMSVITDDENKYIEMDLESNPMGAMCRLPNGKSFQVL